MSPQMVPRPCANVATQSPTEPPAPASRCGDCQTLKAKQRVRHCSKLVAAHVETTGPEDLAEVKRLPSPKSRRNQDAPHEAVVPTLDDAGA